MIISNKDLKRISQSKRKISNLVIGAGGDGYEAKTRIIRGNTSKLVNLLQDKIHFVPFENHQVIRQNVAEPKGKSNICELTGRRAT